MVSTRDHELKVSPSPRSANSTTLGDLTVIWDSPDVAGRHRRSSSRRERIADAWPALAGVLGLALVVGVIVVSKATSSSGTPGAPARAAHPTRVAAGVPAAALPSVAPVPVAPSLTAPTPAAVSPVSLLSVTGRVGTAAYSPVLSVEAGQVFDVSVAYRAAGGSTVAIALPPGVHPAGPALAAGKVVSEPFLVHSGVSLHGSGTLTMPVRMPTTLKCGVTPTIVAVTEMTSASRSRAILRVHAHNAC